MAVYQQKEITIKIIDSNNTPQSQQQESKKDIDKKTKEKGKLDINWVLHPGASLASKIEIGDYAIGSQAYGLIKNTVITSVESSFSRYTTLREDYLAQQTISNVKKTIGLVNGAASSIISGAVMGSGAGPVGAVVGATIGAAGFGIQQYYNYQQRMSGYYQQLNQQNFETSFNARRMGLIDGGRGTEN